MTLRTNSKGLHFLENRFHTDTDIDTSIIDRSNISYIILLFNDYIGNKRGSIEDPVPNK